MFKSLSQIQQTIRSFKKPLKRFKKSGLYARISLFTNLFKGDCNEFRQTKNKP